MISKKYETIVGLFVVTSLVALLVMVLIIAREEGLWQDYIQYKAVFKNISGLKRGSEVRLAGVTVGSVNHPMEEKHYIEWIELIADGNVVFRKNLNPGEAPEAEFRVTASDVRARAYCNLHGLWTS